MSGVLVFGATSAIAQAVARRFAAEGMSLHLVARDPERLAAVAADLLASGAPAVTTETADLTETARHAALVAEGWRRLGVVASALVAHGALTDQAEAERDPAALEAGLRVNLLSPASLLMRLADAFEAQGHGTLAVLGSVAGDRGRASNHAYGAAKGGLRVLAQGLRHRLGRSGVGLVLVQPGFVSTPMTAHLPRGGPLAARLWASPERVARDIHRAMLRGRPAILYTPWYWRPVTLLIRALPDALLSRTGL